MEQLAAAQKAAIETGKTATAHGGGAVHPEHVRALGSTVHVPVRGGKPDAVQELNDRAKIPYTRVVEAADSTP